LYNQSVPVCSILSAGKIQMSVQAVHLHFFLSSIPWDFVRDTDGNIVVDESHPDWWQDKKNPDRHGIRIFAHSLRHNSQFFGLFQPVASVRTLFHCFLFLAPTFVSYLTRAESHPDWWQDKKNPDRHGIRIPVLDENLSMDKCRLHIFAHSLRHNSQFFGLFQPVASVRTLIPPGLVAG